MPPASRARSPTRTTSSTACSPSRSAPRSSTSTAAGPATTTRSRSPWRWPWCAAATACARTSCTWSSRSTSTTSAPGAGGSTYRCSSPSASRAPPTAAVSCSRGNADRAKGLAAVGSPGRLEREDEGFPGRLVQEEAASQEVVAVSVVDGVPELVLEAPPATAQVGEGQAHEALSLVGREVHGHDEPLCHAVVPGEGHEAVVAAVTVPRGRALEEPPTAVVQQGAPEDRQEPLVERLDL